jgi:hypothetical protein
VSETKFENEIETLLDQLCREWGVCLPCSERHRIAASPRLEAREFALEVLRAEGFPEPESETKRIKALAWRFEKLFGRSVIIANISK